MPRHFSRMVFPLFSRLPILSLLSLLLIMMVGCSREEPEGRAETTDGKEMPISFDSISTTLVNSHPVLDAQVRGDTLLLVDLQTLIKDGIVLESDMKMIGAYVREHGGMESLDPSIRRMTYRQMLDRALLIDFSDSTDAATECADCTDSVLIYLPASHARVYFGMAKKSLQKMIAEAIEKGGTDKAYEGKEYSRKIDSVGWRQQTTAIFNERKDQADVALFGNVLVLLAAENRPLQSYTYGEILTIVDRVKAMPEYEQIHPYFRSLE